MSTMSIKNDHFYLPVCDSFKPRILNDQLCYEVDLDQYKTDLNIANKLKSGLVFLMDYNEDRQITLEGHVERSTYDNLIGAIDKSSDDEKAIIFLDTIGKHVNDRLWVFAMKHFDNFIL